MNRLDFEERLSSIVIPEGTPTEEIHRLVSPICEVIAAMLPHSLFKYRSCRGKYIDALKNDEIHAASADKFNDPYDTLVRYDFDGMKKFADTFASPVGLEILKTLFIQGMEFPDEYKRAFPEDLWRDMKERVLATSDFNSIEGMVENNKQQLLALVSTWFPILSSYGKRHTPAACFSEDVQSILMWSHYGDSHKGFALEYDFRPTLTNPLPNVGLYPVIYSDERFDASSFLMWELFTLMGTTLPIPDMLAPIKSALYKSKLWEYEKEWRMIDSGPHDLLHPTDVVIKYRPVAIYYGQRIEEENKKALHGIAVEKGLKEYDMEVDYVSSSYKMCCREISF